MLLLQTFNILNNHSHISHSNIFSILDEVNTNSIYYFFLATNILDCIKYFKDSAQELCIFKGKKYHGFKKNCYGTLDRNRVIF